MWEGVKTRQFVGLISYSRRLGPACSFHSAHLPSFPAATALTLSIADQHPESKACLSSSERSCLRRQVPASRFACVHWSALIPV